MGKLVGLLCYVAAFIVGLPLVVVGVSAYLSTVLVRAGNNRAIGYIDREVGRG